MSDYLADPTPFTQADVDADPMLHGFYLVATCTMDVQDFLTDPGGWLGLYQAEVQDALDDPGDARDVSDADAAGLIKLIRQQYADGMVG